ncbi:MAG: ABC transporter substrate-binding protein, partial [Chloroflexi bacterium]|nr:ABC transporter substrate-binding protein [Chloroflexota bacterium]
EIHGVFAQTLRTLAAKAGPDAPLCVIAHSLGTIIASNYLYDLQQSAERDILPDSVKESMTDAPLEQGRTLALLYTLGSPIALWSLRYPDFGKPICVPSPLLKEFHPNLTGEWVNFYAPPDVIAFPIKTLNEAYAEAVTRDEPVWVGNVLMRWNPASHLAYWTGKAVVDPIVDRLCELWHNLNP